MSDKLVYGSLTVGDVVHLDPQALPELRIISAEEAEAIDRADTAPRRQFVISWGEKDGPARGPA